MNPDEVLEILRAGNERYLNGKTHKHDFHADRAELTPGPEPHCYCAQLLRFPGRAAVCVRPGFRQTVRRTRGRQHCHYFWDRVD